LNKYDSNGCLKLKQNYKVTLSATGKLFQMSGILQNVSTGYGFEFVPFMN